jgi:hypothetical protein
LGFLVEAVAVVDGGQQSHQNPIIRPLIEFCLVSVVVFVKNFTDEHENFSHNFMFSQVELECGLSKEDQ